MSKAIKGPDMFYFRYLFISAIILFSPVTEAKVDGDDNKPVWFNNQVTAYHYSDFNFWGKNKEPFCGGSSDEYAATADQWLGRYAVTPEDKTWYRIIPDDDSTVDIAPQCSIQYIDTTNGKFAVTTDHTECRLILASTEKAGPIPAGQKGALLDFGKYYAFLPLQQTETLPGQYPEASRSPINLRWKKPNVSTVADIRIMLNEIFARYGYIFTPGGEMDTWFRAQPWYKPKYSDVSALLTDTEHDNVKYLKSILSDEVQQDKQRLFKAVTDFCRAVKTENIQYILDNSSDIISYDVNQMMTKDVFQTRMQEFLNIMKQPENCSQELPDLINENILNESIYNYSNNIELEYDQKKKKYLLSYIAWDERCLKNNEQIELSGFIVKRSSPYKETAETLMFKTVEFPCVSGINANNTYVMLEVPAQEYDDYIKNIYRKVTLKGKVKVNPAKNAILPVSLIVDPLALQQ
ncbi:DUF4459 domain-containing protein [Enterobacteriaceae bacterium G50]|nr:DUF4459 domain-containing protein [Enterobacteriaceae bacterium G50]